MEVVPYHALDERGVPLQIITPEEREAVKWWVWVGAGIIGGFVVFWRVVLRRAIREGTREAVESALKDERIRALLIAALGEEFVMVGEMARLTHDASAWRETVTGAIADHESALAELRLLPDRTRHIERQVEAVQRQAVDQTRLLSALHVLCKRMDGQVELLAKLALQRERVD